MCLLIVMTGLDPEYPILVASNRDEARDRPASPPGLVVGRRRMLSPRDRRAGGTWMAVGETGMFAGLTNLAGSAPRPEGRSRGKIPHLALDADDLDAAVRAVEQATAENVYAGFQLVLSEGRRAAVLVHENGRLEVEKSEQPVLVLSNEHRLGELELPLLAPALEPGLDVRTRLARAAPVLLDQGESSGHRVLKLGGEYGTVSSSLIAVHRDDPRRMIWQYAAGSPDQAPYRDFGNLGRQLVEG